MKTLIVIETGAELMQLIRGELADEPHNYPPLPADAALVFESSSAIHVRLRGTDDYILEADGDDVIKALVLNVGLNVHIT